MCFVAKWIKWNELLFVLLSLLIYVGDGKIKTIGKKRRPHEECAVFSADAHYAMTITETFINIGSHYAIDDGLNIHFYVFPDRLSHDGVLLSTGTENFEYYEWKTKAVKTQFFVIEFYFSALSMLMKALNQYYMETLEVFRTYPDSYFLGDANWHEIRVVRYNGTWTLYFDDIVRTQTVTEKNDVRIHEEQVYIGGKPGQYHYQFRGIIKNLSVNGNRVLMGDKPKQGLVETWDCTASKVLKMQQEIQAQEEPRKRLP